MGPEKKFLLGAQLLWAALEWLSGRAVCGHYGSILTDMPVAVPPGMIFSMAQQLLLGHTSIIIEASRSHSDTPHSLGLLWTSDQADIETST